MSNNTNRKRIAIVSPLYEADLSDNISLTCKNLITELKNSFDLTILTTCAKESFSWKNTYPEGEHLIDNTRVLRFPVKCLRKKNKYIGYHRFLYKEWSPNEEEVKWFDEQGPYAIDLCNYLHSFYIAFDVIIFLDSESYTTAVCMLGIPNALLMPLIQNQEILQMFHIQKVFAQPVGFIFQDQKEQNLIYSLFSDAKGKPYIVSDSKDEDLKNLINQVDFVRNKKVSDSYNFDTYINRKITPAFAQNNIAVVFSSDDRYVYILSVALQSLIDKTDTLWNYDICIISDGIQDRKKEILKSICSEKKNVSLRFIEISHLLDTIQLNTYKNRLSRTTFARLYIPELFSEYSKILSLDCDLIIKKDISELYNTKVDNYFFAAIPDVGVRYLFKFIKNYISYIETIGISKIETYFNAGVLLFNIEEIKKNYSVTNMIEMITEKKFHFDEQDAFNCFAQNHVKLLELKWNLFWHEHQVYQEILMLSPEYCKAYNNPYILHYSGGVVPTSCYNSRFASEFWKVARNTPSYETILNIAINNYNKQTMPQKHSSLKAFFESLRKINQKLKNKGLVKTIKFCLYRLKYYTYFKR